MAKDKDVLKAMRSSYKAESADNPVSLKSTHPPRRNRKPVAQDIKITARQYVRANGHRWDNSQGFLLEMKLKFGPESKQLRSGWDLLWSAFWSRPV